ncbi:MAG: Lrp/AsnC family transcriptional regulator [Candidatus Thermoplasmatota archaeon]|nr:Lrp/AsnC family transcriptional regulator [Candidatus Thermoplasmatota archaeon]
MKLSKNERLILWGMVRFPMLNDRQLSDRINIRMSTLNAIKNKMKRTGIIHDRLVPNINIMDYEVLTVGWTPLDRAVRDDKDRRSLIELFKKHPNTYSAMVFGDTLFYISLYRDYTHYRASERDIRISLNEYGLLSGNILHSTIYPMSLSHMNKNFDYTDVLERAFNIEPVSDPAASVTESEKALNKFHHLTNKEKLILKGLLGAPDMPDNKIAQKLDTTRQAVARHKKELLDLGVIKKTRVIDYGLLGFNILCLVEAHYDRFKERELTYPNTDPLHLPSFFSIYGLNETVSLSLFHDFTQFSTAREEYTALVKDHFKVRGEPMILLFSPSKTFTIKHQDYLPLIEEYLSSS